MAFENSPRLDGKSSLKIGKTRNWISRNRIQIILVFAGIGILLIGWNLLPAVIERSATVKYGGLDGCLMEGESSAAVRLVAILDQEKFTDEQGCFFFARVPEGEYMLKVQLNSSWEPVLPVEIKGGNATILGEIILD